MNKKLTTLLFIFLIIFSKFCMGQAPTPIPITTTGIIDKNEVWSGNVTLTGDVIINEGITLTILPSTTVRITSLFDD